jgi:hypothetical protein
MTTAAMRVILGDDPNTMEEEHELPMVDGLLHPVVGVEVPGMGHVLYMGADDNGPERALFTQGPGRERYIDPTRVDSETVEIPIVVNGRGQRRMVVVIRGVEGPPHA